MDRLGARFWLLILGLAVTFAGTAWSIANWRELRDGWRISQVKGQPGYPELKARWQKIAVASESLRWPREASCPKQQEKLRALKRLSNGKWPGAAMFYQGLKRLTDEAESRARSDFAGRWYNGMQRLEEHDGRAIAELVRLRAAGRLSESTFERAMFVLVRDDNYVLDGLEPEAQRVAARLLCDLVGDGGAPVIRQPAANLAEAIGDAARTRRAGALCMTWKVILRYCHEPWSGDRLWEKEAVILIRKAAVGDHEREAYAALEGITACTNPLPAWHVESGGVVVRILSDLEVVLDPPFSAKAVPRHGTATDPGWRAAVKSATEALAGRNREDGGKLQDIEKRLKSDVVSRERLVELIHAEGERLPADLRAPYFSVLRWLFAEERFARAVDSELAEHSGRPDKLPSPSLRLVAEMIRTWS